MTEAGSAETRDGVMEVELERLETHLKAWTLKKKPKKNCIKEPSLTESESDGEGIRTQDGPLELGLSAFKVKLRDGCTPVKTLLSFPSFCPSCGTQLQTTKRAIWLPPAFSQSCPSTPTRPNNHHLSKTFTTRRTTSSFRSRSIGVPYPPFLIAMEQMSYHDYNSSKFLYDSSTR
ncbi:hypothetical protein BT69DRAFT_593271 [Atractiella rhizophila]|nr:hypothetical protein BT69DRAFT_593271 [Atractiella rhizophila]